MKAWPYGDQEMWLKAGLLETKIKEWREIILGKQSFELIVIVINPPQAIKKKNIKLLKKPSNICFIFLLWMG